MSFLAAVALTALVCGVLALVSGVLAASMMDTSDWAGYFLLFGKILLAVCVIALVVLVFGTLGLRVSWGG